MSERREEQTLTINPGAGADPTGAAGTDAPRRSYLLVIEGTSSSIFPLPPIGEVIVGRAEDALSPVDDVKREAYRQRAPELAINDTGVIPLHFQVNLWGARDGITYAPRTDENTLAWKFVPGGAARK
jgi:hypothetical protein